MAGRRIPPRNANACETALRVAQLLKVVHGSRYALTPSRLAETVNLSERTVRRYLEAFEMAGIQMPPWRTYRRTAA